MNKIIYDNEMKNYQEYCRKLKLYQDIEEFKRKLDYNESDYISDRHLYNTYINAGYNPNDDIKIFLSMMENKYNHYVKYNEHLIKYEEYKSKLELYLNKKRELEMISPRVKLQDSDDGTSIYAKNLVPNLELILRQLFCPHCQKGLYYNDGILAPGELNISQRDSYIMLLNGTKVEIEKRISFEKISNELEAIGLPDEVFPPKEQEILEKPKLNTFMVPKMSYNTLLEIEKLKQMEHIENPITVDLPEMKKILELEEIFPNEQCDQPKLIPNGGIYETPKMKYQMIIHYNKLFDKLKELKLMKTPIDMDKPTLDLLTLNEVPLLENLYEPVGYIRDKEFIVPKLSFDMIDRITKLKTLFVELRRIEIPQKVNKPDDVVILELEKEIPIKIINKPNLDTFDVPILPYKDLLAIEKSKDLIETYHKVKEYNGPIYGNDAKNLLKNLQDKKDKYNAKEKEKEILLNQLKNLPELDHDIVNKINQKEQEKNLLERKIEACKYSNEYYNICTKINHYDQEISRESSIFNQMVSLNKFITELSSRFIQETIDVVNASIKIILEELFTKPITVRILSHRTLKNGDEKLEVNLDISYNGIPLDSYRSLSGGEQDRVSLALILSFSQIKNQPILILDEIMSSLGSHDREKAIDIINRWAKDKFVIHICHEIVKGEHEFWIDL